MAPQSQSPSDVIGLASLLARFEGEHAQHCHVEGCVHVGHAHAGTVDLREPAHAA